MGDAQERIAHPLRLYAAARCRGRTRPMGGAPRRLAPWGRVRARSGRPDRRPALDTATPAAMDAPSAELLAVPGAARDATRGALARWNTRWTASRAWSPRALHR